MLRKMIDISEGSRLHEAATQTSEASFRLHGRTLLLRIDEQGITNSVGGHYELDRVLGNNCSSLLEEGHIKVGCQLHAEWLLAEGGMAANLFQNLFHLLKIVRNRRLAGNIGAR
jgi:hypothetical protein